MKTLGKFITLFFVCIAFVVGYEIYLKNDPNYEFAQRILLEELYVKGGKVDLDKIAQDLPYLELKRKLLSGEHNPSFDTEVKKLSSSQKLLLNGLIAIRYLNKGNCEKFNNYIIKSYIEMLSAPVEQRDRFVYELVGYLANNTDKLSQEYAVMFLLKQRYSTDKFVHLYLLLNKKYSRIKLLELIKDKKFKEENRRLYYAISNQRNINLKKYSNEKLEKHFYYEFAPFATALRYTMKRDRFNYPILAYFSYLWGDDNRYKHYKEKSISAQQFEDMNGAIFEYVEIATKLFCMSQDFDTALILISNMPNSRHKNMVLKHVARYFCTSKDSIEKALASDLFWQN